jgi:hypothetical protein
VDDDHDLVTRRGDLLDLRDQAAAGLALEGVQQPGPAVAGLRLGVGEGGVEVGPLQVRVDQGEHPGHVAPAVRLVGRTDQGLVFLGHDIQYRAGLTAEVVRLERNCHMHLTSVFIRI